MDEARVFQALSDVTRLEILRLLAPAPMNVTRIVAHLKCAQPAVSRHLKILREAALLTGERKGKEIEYSVDAEAVLAAAGYLERLMGGVARARVGGRAGAAKVAGASKRGATGAAPGKAAEGRPARDFVSREAEYAVEHKQRDLDDFLL
jgi:DNA-binding transcriptional ArsR family regulator